MNGNPSLLISELSIECSEAELTFWIEGRGYDVASVVIIRDVVSGTSPSFAHVELRDLQSLDHAVRLLNGQSIQGRAIRVSRINTRTQSAGQHSGRHREASKLSVL
jgi:RNA recognition motif-containing protein